MSVLAPQAPAEAPVEPMTGPPERRELTSVPGSGDRVFIGLMRLGAVGVVAVIAMVGLFLAVRAAQAISVAKFSFLRPGSRTSTTSASSAWG